MDMYECIERLNATLYGECDLTEIKTCVEALLNAAVEFKFECYEKAAKSEAMCENYKIAYNKRGKEIHRMCVKINELNKEIAENNEMIGYDDETISDLRVRNENYLDEIETLKERIKNLQNVIERLGGENG